MKDGTKKGKKYRRNEGRQDRRKDRSKTERKQVYNLVSPHDKIFVTFSFLNPFSICSLSLVKGWYRTSVTDTDRCSSVPLSVWRMWRT